MLSFLFSLGISENNQKVTWIVISNYSVNDAAFTRISNWTKIIQSPVNVYAKQPRNITEETLSLFKHSRLVFYDSLNTYKYQNETESYKKTKAFVNMYKNNQNSDYFIIVNENTFIYPRRIESFIYRHKDVEDLAFGNFWDGAINALNQGVILSRSLIKEIAEELERDNFIYIHNTILKIIHKHSSSKNLIESSCTTIENRGNCAMFSIQSNEEWNLYINSLYSFTKSNYIQYWDLTPDSHEAMFGRRLAKATIFFGKKIFYHNTVIDAISPIVFKDNYFEQNFTKGVKVVYHPDLKLLPNDFVIYDEIPTGKVININVPRIFTTYLKHGSYGYVLF